MKNKLIGGLADKKKLKDFDQRSLKAGAKTEAEEHTKNKAIATEIAADHLSEDPKYYKKLKTIEKDESGTPDPELAGLEPLKKRLVHHALPQRNPPFLPAVVRTLPEEILYQDSGEAALREPCLNRMG